MKDYSIPIICTSCAATGSVNKLTAGLQHSCGGGVDLYLGTDDQLRAVAARETGGFAAWMGREAANEGVEKSDGSNEYAGPMPGPNQMSNHEGEITCPVCRGSGKDIQDATDPCRECGGDGKVTPTTTAADVQVARHDYAPSGPTQKRDYQTKVPFMGTRRRQAVSGYTGVDYPLAPSEGHPPPSGPRRRDQSVDEVTDEAKAEIDRRVRDRLGTRRSAKTTGRTVRADMIQTVARTNPGLRSWEVEALVDETLRRYPEVR